MQLLPSRVAAAFRVLENFQGYRVALSGAATYSESTVPIEIDNCVPLPSEGHAATERTAIRIITDYLKGQDMGDDPLVIALSNIECRGDSDLQDGSEEVAEAVD